MITRIEGRPQDVIINRTEGGATTVVSRPRVLEVVCRGDVIRVVTPTYVVLTIDGAGPVRVDPKTPYTIPSRSGTPTMAGNAYRNLADNVMPDMKRLAWNVRLKGAGDDFGFALPALIGGGEKIQAGNRALLVRLVGGTAPYRVELTGGATSLTLQSSDSHQVLLPKADLTPGVVHAENPRLHAPRAGGDLYRCGYASAGGCGLRRSHGPGDPHRGSRQRSGAQGAGDLVLRGRTTAGRRTGERAGPGQGL